MAKYIMLRLQAGEIDEGISNVKGSYLHLAVLGQIFISPVPMQAFLSR